MLEQRIRAELNPAQAEAVLVCDRPQLVLAGAGSGKTRVLTWKIAWLIGGMGRAPWEILALTFTNKAAKEMRERAAALCGDKAPEWMGTFHGICARILRREAGLLGYGEAFTIYDDGDQRKVLTEVCEKLSIKTPTPDVFRKIISSAKNRDEGAADLAKSPDPVSQKAAQVFEGYAKALKAADAMDFDDLLLNVLELFRRHPERQEAWSKRFQYILIDEYQDTNSVQYGLVKRLAAHGRIMVVGDDDQSIYSWRGADISNILGFEKDFPNAHVVKLEQNYRSTGNILKAAGSVIKNNKGRKEKTLWTESDDGDPVSMWSEEDDTAESRRCAQIARKALSEGKGVAVLYRTNSQSRSIEEGMRRDGVPYIMIGGTRFYDRAEVKDALAWLRLLVNPKDFRALERAVQAPRRGIGEKTLDVYRQTAEWKHGGDLVAALAEPPPEGVRGNKAQGMGELFKKWRWALGEEIPLEELVERVIVESGLEAAFEQEGTDEAKERLANLQELVTAARDYRERNEEGGLGGFLEEAALVSDADKKEPDGKAAVLMTLHNSKGLEYDVVCLAGCEEGLFPLLRSDGGGQEALEEERRLFYVGATRARKKLHVMNCRVRSRFGIRDAAIPSRFLDEMDPQSILWETSAPARRASAMDHADHEGFSGGTMSSQGGSSTFGPGGWKQPGSARRPAFPPGALSSAKGPASLPPPSRGFSGKESTAVPMPATSGTDSLYKAGLRVTHPKFGTGRIVKVHGTGNAARLDVQFGSETKRLVAAFAGLSILG